MTVKLVKFKFRHEGGTGLEKLERKLKQAIAEKFDCMVSDIKIDNSTILGYIIDKRQEPLGYWIMELTGFIQSHFKKQFPDLIVHEYTAEAVSIPDWYEGHLLNGDCPVSTYEEYITKPFPPE